MATEVKVIPEFPELDVATADVGPSKKSPHRVKRLHTPDNGQMAENTVLKANARRFIRSVNIICLRHRTRTTMAYPQPVSPLTEDEFVHLREEMDEFEAPEEMEDDLARHREALQEDA